MKEKFLGLRRVLAVAFVAALFTAVLLSNYSCKPHARWVDPVDSTFVAEFVTDQIQGVVNPQFVDVQDLLDYRQHESEVSEIDSVFECMSEAAIRNVSAVVLKHDGVIDKRSVVFEYRQHKDVYDNLPVQKSATMSVGTPKDVDLAGTDLGDRSEEKPFSTTVTYDTDTATGKKVQIKTEKRYVR